MVALDLKEWPIYIQKRIGRGWAEFYVCKIKSIPNDRRVICNSPEESDQADEQATSFTRKLRRLKLDEIPQILVNILAGSMSFVGPRPYKPEHVDRDYIPGKLCILPGLTGLEQIYRLTISLENSGRRADKERIQELNEFYGAYGCVWIDIWIIIRTLQLLLTKTFRTISIFEGKLFKGFEQTLQPAA